MPETQLKLDKYLMTVGSFFSSTFKPLRMRSARDFQYHHNPHIIAQLASPAGAEMPFIKGIYIGERINHVLAAILQKPVC